jgi:HSP20 family protein
MFKDLLPSLRRQSSPPGKTADLPNLFEQFWRDPFAFSPFAGGGEYPSVDVSEDEANVTVTAELPGLESKDVEISISGNALHIRGEKKFEEEEKKENYHRIERSYGCFSRSIQLPAEVVEDKVTAKYDKGVLRVILPKSEKSKARKIKIEP